MNILEALSELVKFPLDNSLNHSKELLTSTAKKRTISIDKEKENSKIDNKIDDSNETSMIDIKTEDTIDIKEEPIIDIHPKCNNTKRNSQRLSLKRSWPLNLKRKLAISEKEDNVKISLISSDSEKTKDSTKNKDTTLHNSEENNSKINKEFQNLNDSSILETALNNSIQSLKCNNTIMISQPSLPKSSSEGHLILKPGSTKDETKTNTEISPTSITSNPETTASINKDERLILMKIEPVYCIKCKRVMLQTDIHNHVCNENPKQKYICITCHKYYYCLSTLFEHQKLEHPVIKYHVCQYCGTGCSTKNALNYHIVAMHLRKKIWKCTKCEEICDTMCDLQKHQKIHFSN